MSHQKHQSIIDALNNCIAECNHCAVACLDEQDVKSLSKCIKLDIDCAQICSLMVSFLSRGSEHAMHLMKECAEICDACAAQCEKHAHHHEHCKVCAESCRKCAEECRKMSS